MGHFSKKTVYLLDKAISFVLVFQWLSIMQIKCRLSVKTFSSSHTLTRTVKMSSAAYLGSEPWKNTSHTMGCNNKKLKPNCFHSYSANRTKYIIWTSDNYQPSPTQDQEYVLFIFASGRQIFLNENRKYSLTLLGVKGVHYPAWGR